MMKTRLAALLLGLSGTAYAAVDHDLGADLRIREELVNNCPGLPYGGGLRTPARGAFVNHVRFRPRVWGEVRFGGDDIGNWRLRTRLTDEFRWNIEPHKDATTWPDEVILDNLFLDGKGLFDGFLDVGLGRRDLMGYADGMTHIFADGTPGDGSRSVYADMATATLNFDEHNKLDLFAMHNSDDNRLRWGTNRSKHRSLTSRFPGADVDQNDWSGGAVWKGRAVEGLDYQLVGLSKKVEHLSHTELVGVRLLPKFNEEWSGVYELFSELNREWSTFAEVQWKSAREGFRPYARFGYHYMSGEWDPMWGRSALDSELFLFGVHDGVAWWSNTQLLRLTGGLEFAPRHTVELWTEPLFAAEKDGLGGGGGAFKGELTRATYTFPLLAADRAKGERFEIVGHVMFEHFLPGDYYSTDKPAFFFRWQVEFRF